MALLLSLLSFAIISILRVEGGVDAGVVPFRAEEMRGISCKVKNLRCDITCLPLRCVHEGIYFSEDLLVTTFKTDDIYQMNVKCPDPLSCTAIIKFDPFANHKGIRTDRKEERKTHARTGALGAIAGFLSIPAASDLFRSDKGSVKVVQRIECTHDYNSCHAGQYFFRKADSAEMWGNVRESLITFKKVRDAKILAGLRFDSAADTTFKEKQSNFRHVVEKAEILTVSRTSMGETFKTEADRSRLATQKAEDKMFFMNTVLTQEVGTFVVNAMETHSLSASVFNLGGVKGTVEFNCLRAGSCAGSIILLPTCGRKVTIKCTHGACDHLVIMVRTIPRCTAKYATLRHIEVQTHSSKDVNIFAFCADWSVSCVQSTTTPSFKLNHVKVERKRGLKWTYSCLTPELSSTEICGPVGTPEMPWMQPKDVFPDGIKVIFRNTGSLFAAIHRDLKRRSEEYKLNPRDVVGSMFDATDKSSLKMWGAICIEASLYSVAAGMADAASMETLEMMKDAASGITGGAALKYVPKFLIRQAAKLLTVAVAPPLIIPGLIYAGIKANDYRKQYIQVKRFSIRDSSRVRIFAPEYTTSAHQSAYNNYYAASGFDFNQFDFDYDENGFIVEYDSFTGASRIEESDDFTDGWNIASSVARCSSYDAIDPTIQCLNDKEEKQGAFDNCYECFIEGTRQTFSVEIPAHDGKPIVNMDAVYLMDSHCKAGKITTNPAAGTWEKSDGISENGVTHPLIQTVLTTGDAGKETITPTWAIDGHKTNPCGGSDIEDGYIYGSCIYTVECAGKKVLADLRATLKETQLKELNSGSTKELSDSDIVGDGAAHQQYWNLLEDYEYDVAIEEAREERAIQRLKGKKKAVLTAKQREKNMRRSKLIKRKQLDRYY